eukprot:scaffold18692_cov67-Isochrysis_galbana.AAC.1
MQHPLRPPATAGHGSPGVQGGTRRDADTGGGAVDRTLHRASTGKPADGETLEGTHRWGRMVGAGAGEVADALAAGEGEG